MHIDHTTIRTAAVLLTCFAFLALTGSLTGVRDQEGCRVTIPVINTWVGWPRTAFAHSVLRFSGCSHRSMCSCMVWL